MIVLCNGCFDPCHVGHVYHLQAASKWGILYVSVTMDEFVNKGPGRPVYPLKQRMDHIRALECVHGVLPVKDALEALMSIKPDIFVKGREYEGKILPEHLDYCREHGIEIRFTDEPVYSSTALLRHDRLQQG